MSALDGIRVVTSDLTTRYAREERDIQAARLAIIGAASMLVEDDPVEWEAAQLLLRASSTLAEAQRVLAARGVKP